MTTHVDEFYVIVSRQERYLGRGKAMKYLYLSLAM